MPLRDVGSATRTWVRSIYELWPRLHSVQATTGLTEVFDYGRFTDHVEASRLLPKVAHQVHLPGEEFSWEDDSVAIRIASLTVLLLVTPRGDPLLVLSTELADEADADAVARFLATTCFGRERMRIAGQPVTAWLAAQLGLPDPLQFGRNVHQCVFPGGKLARELLDASLDQRLSPAATSIVYRGTVSPERGSRMGVRVPRELNHPGEALVAHVRGVSLLAGWNRQVQNVLTLTATTIVSAMGVLYRTRGQAFEALSLNESTALSSVEDARELVTELSNHLNAVQLDLSFGVEAYLDGVLVPEMIVDSFQTSMREATGLDTALDNTSRMVDRLASVIRARAAVLDAAEQEQREQGGRILNVILAIGSLIALPPSMLLAFFGITSPDVDPARSILDLQRYWAAYGLAWLPFVVLVATGFILRRRIGRTSRLVNATTPAGDRSVRVPKPRAEARQRSARRRGPM